MESNTARELYGSLFKGNCMALAMAITLAIANAAMTFLLAWVMSVPFDILSGASDLSMGQHALEAVAIVAALVILTRLYRVATARFVRRALVSYRVCAVCHLLAKSISSIDAEGTSTYLSGFTNDVTSLETGYLERIPSLVNYATLFVGTIAIMLTQSVPLTMVSIMLAALPLGASLIAGKRLSAAERSVSDGATAFTAMTGDLLAGFSTVKAFRAEGPLSERFQGAARALEGAKYGRRIAQADIEALARLAQLASKVGVVLVGTSLALSGSGITAGGVSMFLILLDYILTPLQEIPQIWASRAAARGLVEKLAASLDAGTEERGSVQMPHDLSEGIELSHVFFAYEAGKPVLRDVSAIIPAGQLRAVVGGSGGGKSTLLSLLMGASTAYGGRVCYEGTEVRDIDPASLFHSVGLVSQQPFLFDASLRDNVTMYRDVDDASVMLALRRAGAGRLVERVGLDAPCGVGGGKLSGGERQRVAIARSLLAGAGTLLFDEATSALDRETAAQVMTSVCTLSGVTRVVVTHRLEAAELRRYDGILVLRDGRIAESGSFDELMAADGYFRALVTVGR